MKRHDALIPLSHEHRDVLMIAHPMKINGPRYKGIPEDNIQKAEFYLRFYDEILSGHARDEEHLVFQKVMGIIPQIDKCVKELTNEHRQIDKLTEDLRAIPGDKIIMDRLGRLLELHVRKEERELFPLIQEAADKTLLSYIGERISSNKAHRQNSCTLNRSKE